MQPERFYAYGMRLRPYGMGCQPKGAILYYDGETIDPAEKSGIYEKYWSIILYAEPLTDEQIAAYELDFLGTAERSGR